MAASLYKAQFALRLCENHDKKELNAYCKTCEMKICSSCIKGDHNLHDWEMITDILREKKHSLPEECKDIRTKTLPNLKKEIDRYNRKIQEEDTRCGKTKSVLNSSRHTYIDTINQIFDDRINVCQRRCEANIQIYTEKRDSLKQKVDNLELMTTSLDEDINTLPDHDILDMEKEMRDELEKALSYSADKYTCTTVFVPGRIDVQALKNMIGEINNVSVEEKNDIDRYSDAISSIKIVSDTLVCVRLRCDEHAKLLDLSEELKTMKTRCFDLTISRNGDFVLSKWNKHCITILTIDEETVRTIDTNPLHPTYITKTENDDILVTLRDDGDRFNLTPTSRRIVRRMTLTGKVLHTYEFREDGKTRLFTLPGRTAENNNNDICVVDKLSKDHGQLVVLHTSGEMKISYTGDGPKCGKIFPVDVHCDENCRILFTEYHSRAIHMLNAEGMFLCELCQYKLLRPYVISIHGDNLWCGFDKGRVKVFKYTK